MKTIYFITGNKGKFIEAQKKLTPLKMDVIQKDLRYPEIQAVALEDVARFGVEYIKKKINQPFLLEDAGLFIEAFDGFPGVFSSYVYYTIGCKGILQLLKEYKGKNRSAVFRSVFAYKEPGKNPRFFIGESRGIISEKEIGDHGFGYDPIFIPDGESRTFAQMETGEKNRFSHRGKSLDKFIDFFKNP
jgi:XTP/dITP diphosphohydrolase